MKQNALRLIKKVKSAIKIIKIKMDNEVFTSHPNHNISMLPLFFENHIATELIAVIKNIKANILINFFVAMQLLFLPKDS